MTQPMRTLLLAAFVFAAAAGAISHSRPAQAAQCAKPVDEATKFGTLLDPVLTIGASTPLLLRLPRPSSLAMRYAMLRLKVAGERQGDWLLTIRDTDFKVLAVLGPDDFHKASGGQPSGDLWTGRLEASDVDLDLSIVDPQNSDLTITIDEALIMPAAIDKDKARYSWRGLTPTYGSLYSGQPTNALGDETKRKVRRLGDQVGFLVGMMRPNLDTTMSWCCSGIMLTDDLFLTNWHCGGWTEGLVEGSVWSKNVCNTTFLDLSWDEDRAGREYLCKEVIKTRLQKELDYTLIRIAPLGGEKARRIGRRVRIAQGALIGGSELRVIHHAECKKKQVSIDCHVKEAERAGRRPIDGVAVQTDFAHDCDTESGSSGAPVFNIDGALVGLHRAGHEMTTPNQCDERNKAVHIRHILEDIKASRPDVYEQIRVRVDGLAN